MRARRFRHREPGVVLPTIARAGSGDKNLVMELDGLAPGGVHGP